MHHSPFRIPLLSILFFGAQVTACSGASASPEADAPATNPPAGRPDDGGGPDASIPDPPSDGGAPDTGPDDRIDPIALGRSWTYDVTILGDYPLCKAGSNVGQVLGQRDVAGKPAFQVQSFCPGAGTSSYAVSGDRVEVYYGGAWVLALDAPVQEGHTWSNGLVSFVWEKAGAVTVPAGTFDDCWTARQVQGPNETVFCRGVGPVRWHYVEGANGYDAVLTAKSF